MKPNRETFLEYIDKHVPFMGYRQTSDGTFFLDIYGYDGGDIYEDGLEGPEMDFEMHIPFTEPEKIDQVIAETADEFNEKKPEVTFTEFCK